MQYKGVKTMSKRPKSLNPWALRISLPVICRQLTKTNVMAFTKSTTLTTQSNLGLRTASQMV